MSDESPLSDSGDCINSVKGFEVPSEHEQEHDNSEGNQLGKKIADAGFRSEESLDSNGIEKTAQDSDYSVISSVESGDVIALAEDELTKLHVETSPSSQQVEQIDQASKDRDLSKSEKELKKLCGNMFEKLEDYVKGEVAGSVEDYALLERMNRSTALKYEEMFKVSATVAQAMHELNGKFSNLRPHLEQIEQIEQEVLALEQAAYKLDGYAKRLEERFKKLEKR